MSRASSKLSAVATPSVGGVSVKRHVLELEASSLAWIARRVGRRLARYLRNLPYEIQGHQLQFVQGQAVPVPMLNALGEPIMVPALPDGEFRENWRWYQTSILGLLKEQRERAKLTPKNGGAVLSDDEYQEALADLVRQSLAAMPDDELEQLLATRRKAAPIEVP